ncbi:MAG: hypothetical protein M1368_10870 [Thaumarchaeota archaeon]|nr:hypothetical protein [Nitrososphaerota archaeon]
MAYCKNTLRLYSLALSNVGEMKLSIAVFAVNFQFQKENPQGMHSRTISGRPLVTRAAGRPK